MNSNQLIKAAEAAFLAYEDACTAWRQSIVPNAFSPEQCAANIASPLADAIPKALCGVSEPEYGLTMEDEDGRRFFVRLRDKTPEEEDAYDQTEDRVGRTQKASTIK